MSSDSRVAPGEAGDRIERLRVLLGRPLTAEELAEQTRLVAEPEQTGMASPKSILVVHLGEEALGIDAACAWRVVPRRPARRVPHRRTEVLSGLCSVDGRLVLAVRLDRLLGLTITDPAPEDRRRTVVLEGASGGWAVDVDRVAGVRRIDAEAITEPPPTVTRAAGRFTSGMATVDGAAITLLDAEAVLAGFEGALR